MKKGIIKKYNPVKGYGFIQAEQDMKKDIFFHCTQLCDTDARRSEKVRRSNLSWWIISADHRHVMYARLGVAKRLLIFRLKKAISSILHKNERKTYLFIA